MNRPLSRQYWDSVIGLASLSYQDSDTHWPAGMAECVVGLFVDGSVGEWAGCSPRAWGMRFHFGEHDATKTNH
jgi:hypothetical protein